MITATEIQMIRNADPGAVLPGIDTVTGNPLPTSSLLNVAQLKPNAAYYYSASRNEVFVTQAGAVLSGINFGTATVTIEADNVTIKDCTFTGTTGYWAVGQTPAYSGAVVENCTFQGTKSPTEGNVWIASNLGITIEGNSFLDSPTDAVDIHSGVVTGNYFSAAAYLPGAHADAIYVTDSTGPTVITDNFIDGTANADAPGQPNSDIRLTNELGNLSDVTVSGNYLIGGGFTVEVVGSQSTVSNVSITNNYIGFGWYGDYWPGTSTLATVAGNTIVDFSNPVYTTEALATYVAAGLPTPDVVDVTSSGAYGGSKTVPTTILGNDFAGAHLYAGGAETNFVAGLGGQYLFSAGGANILTFVAIGDGGDRMAGFDPAKDVIDLSHIDANITAPGVQNFTFIGSAPFSGSGAEVRYQLDPAKDVTYVEADLAGDANNPNPDFTITLAGLVTLTAANFALTPSQSSADLADGVGLTSSSVKTPAGGLSESAYSNVKGRAYTSYEQFWGSGYDNLAADDLNLSSTANELVLYDPSLKVTKSAAGESLQGGTASDPLAYHATETIDATTSGGEQFIFGAGFGKETINGFAASGASPDTIQLATSSFSYLTAGMSQAQDLAAVLAHATISGGGAASSLTGLTITDSRGDSLTLMGLSASTIAANPSAIQFA